MGVGPCRMESLGHKEPSYGVPCEDRLSEGHYSPTVHGGNGARPKNGHIRYRAPTIAIGPISMSCPCRNVRPATGTS